MVMPLGKLYALYDGKILFIFSRLISWPPPVYAVVPQTCRQRSSVESGLVLAAMACITDC
jgi:hypothetical protein